MLNKTVTPSPIHTNLHPFASDWGVQQGERGAASRALTPGLPTHRGQAAGAVADRQVRSGGHQHHLREGEVLVKRRRHLAAGRRRAIALGLRWSGGLGSLVVRPWDTYTGP